MLTTTAHVSLYPSLRETGVSWSLALSLLCVVAKLWILGSSHQDYICQLMLFPKQRLWPPGSHIASKDLPLPLCWNSTNPDTVHLLPWLSVLKTAAASPSDDFRNQSKDSLPFYFQFSFFLQNNNPPDFITHFCSQELDSWSSGNWSLNDLGLGPARRLSRYRLAAKPVGLNSVFRTHTVEREREYHRLSHDIYLCTVTPMHSTKLNK